MLDKSYGVTHYSYMAKESTKTKVRKSYRIHPDIAAAIKRAMSKHGYQDETAFVETVFRRVLGLPEIKQPEPLAISKNAIELRP